MGVGAGDVEAFGDLDLWVSVSAQVYRGKECGRGGMVEQKISADLVRLNEIIEAEMLERNSQGQ